jgi:hypothetical protein
VCLVLNRYTALAIAVQFIACLSIWIIAFALSPLGDRYFGLMFYFYLPAIYLVSTLLGLRGESGMIAAGVYGIGCGTIIYGLIFGMLVSHLKSRRRNQQNS